MAKRILWLARDEVDNYAQLFTKRPKRIVMKARRCCPGSTTCLDVYSGGVSYLGTSVAPFTFCAEGLEDARLKVPEGGLMKLTIETEMIKGGVK